MATEDYVNKSALRISNFLTEKTLSLDGTNLPLSNINFNNFKIKNLGKPTDNKDAVNKIHIDEKLKQTKKYIQLFDEYVEGIDWTHSTSTAGLISLSDGIIIKMGLASIIGSSMTTTSKMNGIIQRNYSITKPTPRRINFMKQSMIVKFVSLWLQMLRIIRQSLLWISHLPIFAYMETIAASLGTSNG